MMFVPLFSGQQAGAMPVTSLRRAKRKEAIFVVVSETLDCLHFAVCGWIFRETPSSTLLLLPKSAWGFSV